MNTTSLRFIFSMFDWLQVEPFAGLVGSVRVNTPRVLLNRDRVGPFKKKLRSSDMALTASLDETINALVDNLGWKNDLDQLLEADKTEAEVNTFSLFQKAQYELEQQSLILFPMVRPSPPQS